LPSCQNSWQGGIYSIASVVRFNWQNVVNY